LNETRTGSKRILIVDDDAIIRNLLALLVRRQGWGVAQASNGEEAVTLLETARGGDGQIDYDLIILDLMMPKMSGWDLIRYLRDHMPEMLRHTVVTSAIVDMDTNDLRDLCGGVLGKPFEPEAFYDAVSRCLRGPYDATALSPDPR